MKITFENGESMEQKEKIAKALYENDWIDKPDPEWEDLANNKYYYDAAEAILPIIEAEKNKVLILADKILLLALHGDYTSGVEAFGIDEGRTKAAELLSKYGRELSIIRQEVNDGE